jgi:2-methylcitrate dehydratase PrpD
MTEQDPEQGATDRLLDFALGLDFAALPAEVRIECVRATVNAVGCIIGGARHPMVEIAHRALTEFEGPRTAPLLGRGAKSDPLTAALMNGLSGAAYSFDDTYSDAMLHPSVPILAALLAAAAREPVPGAAFAVAFAVGLEAACRLTKSLTAAPAEPQIAWSQTGVACGAAAALAVGRLMRIDRKRSLWALGLAASEASGSRATHGSMAASLIYGRAAQTGLRAVLLAAAGFTGPGRPLEHRFGFGAVHSRNGNLAALVQGLGRDFELLSNTYKPYPCGLVIHPALEGILRLRSRTGLRSRDVARIELHVSPNAIAFAANPEPQDELQAKVSLHHWVATAAVTGKAGLAEGRAEWIAHPEIRRLRAVIEAAEEPGCAQDAARVIVMLRDGGRCEERIEHCIGSRLRPMTNDELSEKFMGQAAPVLGREGSESCLEACWNIAELMDVREIAARAG